MKIIKKSITTRELAIRWWNTFGSAQKTQICDINTELVGNHRRHETLTGREIEEIYNLAGYELSKLD